MIRAIVGTSLKLRYIVILLAGAMMVFGISKFPHMPVDVFPEFARDSEAHATLRRLRTAQFILPAGRDMWSPNERIAIKPKTPASVSSARTSPAWR